MAPTPVLPEYGVLKKSCKQKLANQVRLFYCVISRCFIL